MPAPISTPYPLSRAAAWDFCYLYFYRNRGSKLLKGNLERSCLSLGMYLANFGMYRGSSSLMKYSCRIYIPIIEWIAEQDTKRPWLWTFDFCKATAAKLEDLIAACKELKAILKTRGISATGTLVSKIMLGVFGCMPALDTNVREQTGCTEAITIANLHKIQAKCPCGRGRECDRCCDGQNPLPESVIDFDGNPTGIPYPSARILDHSLWSPSI